MRRTVSMKNATNILHSNLSSDDDSIVDYEMTSFRSSQANSGLPKPSSADSLSIYHPTSPFTNTFESSQLLTSQIESLTPNDNKEKLEVLPPSRYSEVPTTGSYSSFLRTAHPTDSESPNLSTAIRLVASASELSGNKGSGDEFWNDTKSSMISSEALIPVKRESERSFFVDGSLESLQENERSNSSLMHPHCSEIPHDQASSSGGSPFGMAYVHKRSFSADIMPGGRDEQTDYNGSEQVFHHDRAKSQDYLTKQENSNLNNRSMFSSPETEEIPRAVDIVVLSSAGSPNMEILNSSVEPLPDSPWVDDQLSPTRIFDFPDNRPRNHVDLPAISEECEQDVLPRSIELAELIDMYVPEVCSPTTFSDKDDMSISPINSPPIPIHRRVVSDNHILYGNNNDLDMKVEVRPREHSTRTGTVSSRCKSQVMLHKAEEQDGILKAERNLSSSDSALNVEKDENEAPDVPTAPPPVVISRKNSTAQASSWQRFLPSGGANPHNVIIPSTASIPTRALKRNESFVDTLNLPSISRHVETASGNGPATSFMRRSLRFLSNVGSRASGSPRSLDFDLLSSVSPSSTTIQDEFPTLRRRATAPHRKSNRRKARSDRSRIEKKKEKGSSEPFFFNLLGTRGRGKKSKERPSVDTIFSNTSSRNLPQSASFPLRRPGDSHRPGIPTFAEASFSEFPAKAIMMMIAPPPVRERRRCSMPSTSFIPDLKMDFTSTLSSKSFLNRISKFIRGPSFRCRKRSFRRSSNRSDETDHPNLRHRGAYTRASSPKRNDYAQNIYLDKLRSLLRDDSNFQDDSIVCGMTRSFSEGDIRSAVETTSEFYEDVIERYGLFSDDYNETVCVPDGVILDNDQCYITEAFLSRLGSFTSLTTPSRCASRRKSTYGDPEEEEVENGFVSRKRLPIRNDDDDEENEEEEDDDNNDNDDIFPPLRASTYPRSRRVSALIFHSLARTLSTRKITLPDVMPSNLFNKWRTKDSDDEDGLPDNISRVFSPTDLDEGVEPERTDLHSQLIDNPKWSRLSLFNDLDHQTWHEKYRHDKLSEKLIKKQDAIYELIMIERQHCANLVFLQQGYRMRLLEENILSLAEVNALIPDVIDALLLFHCNLLEQLIERQKSSDEVETISDILARELSDEGSHTAVCINAYTTFGTAKQKAEQTFTNLKSKISKFDEFLKNCETDKLYRRYEYKSVMAKIIGRPTKYCLLLETIARNDMNQFSKNSEYTALAIQAAKRFALRIDQNLMVAQLARHWEKIRNHFDMNSYTCIYIPDSKGGSVCLKWTLYDICSEINENGRRLMCSGDVWWKVQSGGSCKLNPVTMVLFDDILVLLVKKNSKMAFACNDQAVLPVSNLILRTSGKGQSIMLASAIKPTLLEFEFHTKSDMAKWSSVLDSCINVTRIPIRLSYNNEDKIVMQEEKKTKEEEDMWFRKLNKLFADRCDQEKMLADYLSSRRRFLDELKAHVYSLSWSRRVDLQERVRDAIRTKFKDLRNSRTVPLNKLIEDMSRAKESELLSFFGDDFIDGNDSDDSNSDSSTGKGVRPRRIKTFNGATDSSSKGKLQLRRHTTVPRMSESSESGPPALTRTSHELRREKDEIDERIHQMPLCQPLATRRGCSRLIKDCEKLKTENISLKSELALEKIRVVTLEKIRPVFSPTVTAPGETMEALRKKEKAVREDDARRRSEIEDKKQDLSYAQAEFDKMKADWEEQVYKEKADLRRRESEIAEKWAKLRDVESRAGRLPVSTPTRIPYEKEPKTPPIQELSPLLKSLTVKSEPKRKK